VAETREKTILVLSKLSERYCSVRWSVGKFRKISVGNLPEIQSILILPANHRHCLSVECRSITAVNNVVYSNVTVDVGWV